jgi:hypothetical protein
MVTKQTGTETWTQEDRQAEREYQLQLKEYEKVIWKARQQIEAANQARNDAIVGMAEMGISYRHIAVVSGFSHPTVSEIVRQARQETG